MQADRLLQVVGSPRLAPKTGREPGAPGQHLRQILPLFSRIEPVLVLFCALEDHRGLARPQSQNSLLLGVEPERKVIYEAAHRRFYAILQFTHPTVVAPLANMS